jgi:hypothetical protein
MPSLAGVYHDPGGKECVISLCEPQSLLGYSTGKSCLLASELLIVMKCFFDGSEGGTDDAGDAWITLAGFGAADNVWRTFDDKWRTMLTERYPIAPFIHMWQIISGTDPFEHRTGWTEEKVSSLVTSAIDLLQNLDHEVFRSFTCMVNLSAHERIRKEGLTIEDPATICGQMCVALPLKWRVEANKIEQSYFYFDRGEKFIHGIKELWLKRRTPPGKISIDPSNHVFDLIAEMFEVDMERYPPIQAADMLAWATTRGLSTKERPYRYLAEIMRKVIPHDTAILSEQILRDVYVAKE